MNSKLKNLLLSILIILLIGITILLLEMRERQVETTAKIEFINNYCLE